MFVNGKEHRVRGESAFLPLSDYLRYELGACGTKVVCAEGDCGACSVLIGRKAGDRLQYKAVNGCIQYMFQLDCSHVVTVEGLADSGDLNPIQQSMVDCHGAQCGYCTPGFVVALCGLFEECPQPTRAEIKEALSGNLCRCTGYESIIKAGLCTKVSEYTAFNDKYDPAPMLAAFKKHATEPMRVESKNRVVFNPLEVNSAVQFKRSHEGSVIIAGGTDVCVNMNKRGLEPQFIMSTANLSGLDELKIADGNIVVGATVNLRELEKFVRQLIPEFYKILFIFGSPQIREAGTLAGNIGNGSPIADSLPFLFIMEAEVEVLGVHGQRRIPIRSLYKGYKKLDMSSDELITRVFIPIPAQEDLLKLYKVSRREHLDISTFAAAIRLSLSDGADGNAAGSTKQADTTNGERGAKAGGGAGSGNGARRSGPPRRIHQAQIAYGGVGPTEF